MPFESRMTFGWNIRSRIQSRSRKAKLEKRGKMVKKTPNQQFEHGEGRAGFWHCFGKNNLLSAALRRPWRCRRNNFMQFIYQMICPVRNKGWKSHEMSLIPLKLNNCRSVGYIIIIIIYLLLLLFYYHYYLLSLLYINHNMYHYSS